LSSPDSICPPFFFTPVSSVLCFQSFVRLASSPHQHLEQIPCYLQAFFHTGHRRIDLPSSSTTSLALVKLNLSFCIVRMYLHIISNRPFASPPFRAPFFRIHSVQLHTPRRLWPVSTWKIEQGPELPRSPSTDSKSLPCELSTQVTDPGHPSFFL